MDHHFFGQLLPDIYLQKHLQQAIRTDGRTTTQHRKISYSSGQNGSVFKIGDTCVFAQLELRPIEQSDIEVIRESQLGSVENRIDIKIELEQDQYQDHTHNDRNRYIQYLQNLVCQMIQKQVVDVHEQIKDNRLLITISVLENDGNLVNAVYLAAVLGLLSFDINSQHSNMDLESDYIKMQSQLFLPLSFCKVQNHVLVDPSLSEEKLSQSLITLFCNKDAMIIEKSKGGIFDIGIVGRLIQEQQTLLQGIKGIVQQLIEKREGLFIFQNN